MTRSSRHASRRADDLRAAIDLAVSAVLMQTVRQRIRLGTSQSGHDDRDGLDLTIGLEHLLLGLLTANDDWRLRRAMNALGLSDRKVRRMLRDRDVSAAGGTVAGGTQIAELIGLPESMLGREIPVSTQVASVIRQARENAPGNAGDPLEPRALLRAVVAERDGPVAEVLRLIGADRNALLDVI
jgi:hypothetical protein